MLERLNAHRDWANAKIIEWYLGLPEGEAYCLKMLTHILRSEAVWLARFRGEDPPNDVWDSPLAAADLEPLRASNLAGWRAVLAGDAAKVFRYRQFNGEERESSVADVALHVCMHDQYHRGQIAAQAARAGLQCPSTDYILFTRL